MNVAAAQMHNFRQVSSRTHGSSKGELFAAEGFAVGATVSTSMGSASASTILVGIGVEDSTANVRHLPALLTASRNRCANQPNLQ